MWTTLFIMEACHFAAAISVCFCFKDMAMSGSGNNFASQMATISDRLCNGYQLFSIKLASLSPDSLPLKQISEWCPGWPLADGRWIIALKIEHYYLNSRATDITALSSCETTRKVSMHDCEGIFNSIKATGNLCSCTMGMTHSRTGYINAVGPSRIITTLNARLFKDFSPFSMSCQSCSGNFSSQSFGGHLQYPVSSCGSSYPNNVFHTTDLQTPITHQLGSSHHTGCQESFCEPRSCRTSFVISSPCQRPCYHQRIPVSYRPCHSAFSGSLGFGSRGFQSFGCGYPTLGFGSRGFQSVGCGAHTFSSQNCGSSFYRPTCFSTKSCQSVSYQPTCGNGFFWFHTGETRNVKGASHLLC